MPTDPPLRRPRTYQEVFAAVVIDADGVEWIPTAGTPDKFPDVAFNTCPHCLQLFYARLKTHLPDTNLRIQVFRFTQREDVTAMFSATPNPEHGGTCGR